jgi:uncharacterized repeat protein (TIGR01451 family)
LVTDSFIVSYNGAILIEVSARVISSEGCQFDMDLDMPVAFLSVPTPWMDDVYIACVDDDGLVDISVSGLVTTVEPSISFPGPGTFLPDGTGVTYEVEIEVSGITQEYINGCNDLEYVLLNIEHSWAGDLEIRLTCPDGTSIDIIHYPNGMANAYLGEPIDDFTEGLLDPGIGYDYFWTMSSYLYMGQLNYYGQPTPSVDYLPSQSFCNLIGCPINGTWTIAITDHMDMDNGYLFYSGLSFNVGTIEATNYDYSNSAFNQFTWSSDDFEIIDQSFLQATLDVGDASAGSIHYSYTNPAGCSVSTSSNLLVMENPLTLTLSDDFVYDSEGLNLITAYLEDLSTDTMDIIYYWYPGSLVENPYLLQTHVLPITQNTWITFRADITETLGCSLSDSIFVQLPDNAIHVTVFHDANDNGVFDEGENTVPMFPVSTDAGTFYTAMNGSFLTSIEESSEFSVNIDASNWQLTTPATITLDESGWTGYAQYVYFGIKPTSNLEVDVDVSLSGITPLCNSHSYVVASVFNHSFYYPGGTIEVTIDSLYTVVYPSAPISIEGNVYTYEVPSLGYNQLYSVHLSLQNPAEQEFGETTHHLAEVFYTISPGVMSEVVDTDSLSTTIICAYDPNDKITHTGIGEEGFINPNTDMEYTINFQNIGNAPATAVVVTDEISDLLDITSLQPIAWSHDFVLQVVDNVATFRFEDIQLLGAEQDEELSKGFVRFKIKQQPNLAPGTVIENIAEIVFDNNEAIITNTAVNTIITPTGVADVSSVDLGIYPNPATDVVYWSDIQYKLTTITNAMGQRVAGVSSNRNGQYNTSSLSAGMYILQFENEKAHSIRQTLIVQ